MLKISQTEQAFQHGPHPWDGENGVDGVDGFLEMGRTFRVGSFPNYFHVFPVFEGSVGDTFDNF
jgi:hypothetical protein